MRNCQSNRIKDEPKSMLMASSSDIIDCVASENGKKEKMHTNRILSIWFDNFSFDT